jgi:hypothetical protein
MLAVANDMVSRGKIVVMSSASGLKGMPNYCA